MANNVTNIITLDADEPRTSEVLAAIQCDKFGPGSIDFQKIVPSSNGDDWYEAHQRDWATKWGAFGFDGDMPPYEPGSDTLQFLTAWSRPAPVLQRLSELYPDVGFYHQWADEDVGHNVGEAWYRDGRCLDAFEPQGGSREAYEMAAEIIGEDLESLGLRLLPDGSGYEYFDEDEGLAMQGFVGMEGMC
ncbi:MAG: hypothetical protein LBG83_02320 [Oscillospiraceae bacterium]|jgi:hypothetical protein|nr:hypothetical protein [Oscillospiraceae bacterium]